MIPITNWIKHKTHNSLFKEHEIQSIHIYSFSHDHFHTVTTVIPHSHFILNLLIPSVLQHLSQFTSSASFNTSVYHCELNSLPTQSLSLYYYAYYFVSKFHWSTTPGPPITTSPHPIIVISRGPIILPTGSGSISPPSTLRPLS